MKPQKVTIQAVAHAYGISPSTINKWRDRGVSLRDFLQPHVVAAKLAASAKNRSPRLEKLCDQKTQLEIVFRLAVAGLTQAPE